MPADPASAGMTEAPVPTMARRGLWLASVVLAVVALPILVDRLVLLPLHVSLNPNEGWNALHTAAWLGGRPLYLDPAGLVLNNYPPLSFGVVALLGRFTGDLIIAGRILSLISLLAVAVLAGLIAGRHGATRPGQWFTALLLVATFLVGYTDYVAMNDPQMFGLALATLAVWVLVRQWESRSALLGALVLMLLAGLVKHNLIALPLATLLVMFRESRQRGVTTLVAGAALAVIALLLIRVTWGRMPSAACSPAASGLPSTWRRTSSAAFPSSRCRWLSPSVQQDCSRHGDRSDFFSPGRSWRSRRDFSPAPAPVSTTTASLNSPWRRQSSRACWSSALPRGRREIRRV